ncbi:Leucine-rich repeat - like 10 [Theobroma cacao]|nr:Leucine-rich repeat - like 10 [Theobroma cacao]
MRSQTKIQLDVLSNDEAWTLFKHNAGLDDAPCHSELIDVAQKVAGECKGLPLAIVTIARALREKPLDEWIVANHRQQKSPQLAENQDFCEDIYGCLKFSYDYLKGRKIKSCFLLCSHFPEDYEISIEQLTRYGIGQGLFQDVNFIEDARREMRVILTNLQYSGLLLDTGNEETVKMHDVIRDFAHWIASEAENVMIKAGLGLDEWPNSESLGCCKTISLMNNKIEYLPDKLVCPKLETLLMSGNRLMAISSSSFEGMKTLKVLTLSGGLLPSLEGILWLTNLKTLHLEGCKLHDISSLAELKKLEILDFCGCYLDNIPDEIGELISLRLLDLSYADGHWKIPPNLIRSSSNSLLHRRDNSNQFVSSNPLIPLRLDRPFC